MLILPLVLLYRCSVRHGCRGQVYLHPASATSVNSTVFPGLRSIVTGSLTQPLTSMRRTRLRAQTLWLIAVVLSSDSSRVVHHRDGPARCGPPLVGDPGPVAVRITTPYSQPFALPGYCTALPSKCKFLDTERLSFGLVTGPLIRDTQRPFYSALSLVSYRRLLPWRTVPELDHRR